MNQISSVSIPEMSLPNQYWGALSQEDRNEFIRLRASFHHGQKISSKDRRIVTFSKELTVVLKFLERSSENMENRCILAGVCFVGPIVCVNTRQLKAFLSRCKSSINGSFQQLGFVALRTKSKARNCVLTALPSLQNNQNILRQWTVRYASDETRFCFWSSFSRLEMPEITEDDLYDEKKTNNIARRTNSNPYLPPKPPQPMQFPLNSIMLAHNNPILQQAPRPIQTKHIDFDLSDFDADSPNNFNSSLSSLSVDCFNDIESNWETSPETNDFSTSMFGSSSITRSSSAVIQVPSDWDFDTF